MRVTTNRYNKDNIVFLRADIDSRYNPQDKTRKLVALFPPCTHLQEDDEPIHDHIA